MSTVIVEHSRTISSLESAENLGFSKQQQHRDFICPLKANRKVASLVRRPRSNTGDCVLVVYDKQEASIYFEGQVRPTKETQAS